MDWRDIISLLQYARKTSLEKQGGTLITRAVSCGTGWLCWDVLVRPIRYRTQTELSAQFTCARRTRVVWCQMRATSRCHRWSSTGTFRGFLVVKRCAHTYCGEYIWTYLRSMSLAADLFACTRALRSINMFVEKTPSGGSMVSRALVAPARYVHTPRSAQVSPLSSPPSQTQTRARDEYEDFKKLHQTQWSK